MTTSKVRVAAYLRSLSDDDPEIVHVAGHGRYLPINPMSNESALLESLGLNPEDCVKVDCYWAIEDDVHFVQIQAQSYAGDRGPGVYGRLEDGAGYLANVVVVVPDAMISQAIVEDSLSRAYAVLGAELSVGLRKLD